MDSGFKEEQTAASCSGAYESVTETDRVVNPESANKRNINDKYVAYISRIPLPSHSSSFGATYRALVSRCNI